MPLIAGGYTEALTGAGNRPRGHTFCSSTAASRIWILKVDCRSQELPHPSLVLVHSSHSTLHSVSAPLGSDD